MAMQGGDDVWRSTGGEGRESEGAGLELPSLFAADALGDDAPLSTEELAALLGEFDAASAAVSVGTRAATKKHNSRNSNKARDGRKEELAYLRRSVAELEMRLQALTATAQRAAGVRTAALPRVYGVGPVRSSSGHSTLALPAHRSSSDEHRDMWREIAQRQCDERYRSERENVRLRVVLESQLKVARSLEKFLELKAAAATTEIGKCIDMRRHVPVLGLPDAAASHYVHQFAHNTHHASDAAMFETLIAGVDESIAEVDAVFHATGLARMTTTQIHAQMRLDPGDTAMRVEICATKVLPFSVHETGAAVWNHYRFAKQRMPSRYYSYHSLKSIDATEDTILEDFTLELHAKNTRGSFRMRQAMRRSIEADRIVIAWRSFFDPIELSETPLSGTRFLEKGYIVIQEAPASTVSPPAAPVCTLLRLCFVIAPYSAERGMGDTVGAITDFMLTTTAASVVATHQMIENVLLEQRFKLTQTDRRSDGASGPDETALVSFDALDVWQS